MRKILWIVVLLCVCINLISCGALYHSITGEIIDPVGDFSRANDGTLLYDGNHYVLIEEFNGDFQFDITEEDVLLGRTSNFPFFPDYWYYANANEKADYIAGGNGSEGHFVFLREDLYPSPLSYVLQDTSFEFDFSSAFIKTEEVSYEVLQKSEEYDGAFIYFYVKDYPRLTVKLAINKINEKWYLIDPEESFMLSEDFLNALTENGCLS